MVLENAVKISLCKKKERFLRVNYMLKIYLNTTADTMEILI